VFEIGRIQKVNPKGTQQKSELQKRTNLYSKKKLLKKMELKSTVLQDSSQILSPEDSAQWFPGAVTN